STYYDRYNVFVNNDGRSDFIGIYEFLAYTYDRNWVWLVIPDDWDKIEESVDEKQKAVTYWIKKTDTSPYDVSKEEVEIDDNPLEEAVVKDIDVGLHEDPEYRKKLVSN